MVNNDVDVVFKLEINVEYPSTKLNNVVDVAFKLLMDKVD
jgi:hypothetical protein